MHFENGVVKVQRGDEISLTNLEKNALARFKVDATTASATEDAEESYMEKVRMNGKHAKKTNYRSMNHVSSTSNTVERLFSRAKLVMTPQRRCMDPSNLEAILMLRYNRDLWDIYFIDRIVLKNDVTDHPMEDDPINDMLKKRSLKLRKMTVTLRTTSNIPSPASFR